MSLEFIDGFDHYSTASFITRKWDTGSTISSFPAGRFGGNAISITTSGALATITLASVQTRVAGFAFQFGTLGAEMICQFMDSGTTQVEVRLDATGHLTVTRNATVLGTSSGVYAINTWYYLEFKAKIDPTVGTYEVRVNGASVISGSGNTRNTANSTCNQLRIGTATTGFQNTYDDLYVLNTSGTVNNDFLGECRIFTSLPNADSASASTNTQWTPNAGTTHSTQVDETNPNDDTDYVSSATAGQIDTYKYPSISPTGSIVAVQTVLCDRKDDAGTRTICAEYRSSGGANFDGSISFSPASTYLMHRQLYETDPATSAAWTLAAVNGGEFGVKCLA